LFAFSFHDRRIGPFSAALSLAHRVAQAKSRRVSSVPTLRAWVRYHEGVAAGTRELFDFQPTWQTDAAGLVAELEARGESVRR